MSDWFHAPTPIILGHRGASADAPENTLAAFELAAEQGAAGIEFDVHLSADGVPVIIHDGHLERTTNGHGLVSQHTLAQLQSLDAGMGQTIPTLDELFQAFGPRFLYNVELKGGGWGNSSLEATVAERIEAYQLESRVLVSSFNIWSVWRARRVLSRRTPVGLLHYRYAFWHRPVRLLVPYQAAHPGKSLVDEAYMAWARRHQLRVHVWTVDEVDEARRLLDLGVHGLISNRPGYLIRQLGPG